MKKTSYLLFIASFVILVVALMGLFFSNKTLEEETFYASVEISDDGGPGFDVNATALTFGRISVPGSSTRNIIFENGYDFPVKVKISVEGDIEPFLDFDESIIVDIGEKVDIPFTVSTSQYFSDGFYDGVVRLVVKPA